MDQFLGEQSKLQLAITHVVSALNSSMASVENILHVLDRSPGTLLSLEDLILISLACRFEGIGVRMF